MVLFAEVCSVASEGSGYRNDDKAVAGRTRAKADEFRRLVLYKALRAAKEAAEEEGEDSEEPKVSKRWFMSYTATDTTSRNPTRGVPQWGRWWNGTKPITRTSAIGPLVSFSFRKSGRTCP
jgi:hypothetical protein